MQVMDQVRKSTSLASLHNPANIMGPSLPLIHPSPLCFMGIQLALLSALVLDG